MSPSNHPLLQLNQPEQGRITQLYRYLELFSEGTPPRHSLFVFAPDVGPLSTGERAAHGEQLLIINPPADLSQRFRLGDQVAVLFTGEAQPTTQPQVKTEAGGVAHLRIGDHFLDIYSQHYSAVVHLPALGIIYGGGFGSDSMLPSLAPTSDGSDELDTLRLLARLVKQHRLALYIPTVGNETPEKVVVMERLAADVAYLHALRRIVAPLAQRGEGLEATQELAESALPRDRRDALALTVHQQNVTTLIQHLPR